MGRLSTHRRSDARRKQKHPFSPCGVASWVAGKNLMCSTNGQVVAPAFAVLEEETTILRERDTTLINDRIRAREVRTIGEDGAQLGILPTREARMCDGVSAGEFVVPIDFPPLHRAG